MSDPLLQLRDFFDQYKKHYGTVVSGAVFSAGWFIFIDLVAVSSDHITLIDVCTMILLDGSTFDVVHLIHCVVASPRQGEELI